MSRRRQIWTSGPPAGTSGVSDWTDRNMCRAGRRREPRGRRGRRPDGSCVLLHAPTERAGEMIPCVPPNFVAEFAIIQLVGDLNSGEFSYGALLLRIGLWGRSRLLQLQQLLEVAHPFGLLLVRPHPREKCDALLVGRRGGQ